MNINCLAVDDEPLALEKITEFIRRVDYLSLLGAFHNPLKAISFIKQHPVDLIFLDVQMEELSGIELIESVKPESGIILTTAFSEYALKGYELRIHDYLLKPISFDRFLKSVNTFHDNLLQKKPLQSDYRDPIFVKSGSVLRKIRLEDICYVEGMKDYLSIWTRDERIMTLMSFQQVLEILPSNLFFRIHRSFVVALSKIDQVSRNRVRIGDQYLPIGETFKDAFFQRIGQQRGERLM